MPARAARCAVRVQTVLGVRHRVVEPGREAARNRKPQAPPSRRPVWDGAREARLSARRCRPPPAGPARWTLRLVADQAVAVERGETRSPETVRQACTPRRGHRLGARWGMPPEPRGACGAPREDRLEVSPPPADPQGPLVGMAAQPVQVMQEVRQPLPAVEGPPERYDAEDARHGTAHLFMGTEPLQGVRLGSVREHTTAVDWATEVRQRLDLQSLEVDYIRLVCDNLSTHGRGSLSQACPPEQARGLASRLEIPDTP